MNRFSGDVKRTHIEKKGEIKKNKYNIMFIPSSSAPGDLPHGNH